MTTPYRDELAALNERRESLSRELTKLSQEASQLEELRNRAAALATELSEVEARIGRGGRRPLPMLNDVRVASPCNADWNEMVGDDRVRHCSSCDKDVFNLSAMSRVEAEALLAERMNGETCVRFYRRADGTMMTQDCEVGARRKRRRKFAFAALGGGALIAAGLTSYRAMSSTTMGAIAPVMGEMAIGDDVEMGKMELVDPVPADSAEPREPGDAPTTSEPTEQRPPTRTVAPSRTPAKGPRSPAR